MLEIIIIFEGGHKMLFRLIYLFLIIILIGCAATKKVKLMPEYENVNFESDRLGVLLIKKNLNIQNVDDLFNDLGGGDPKEIYINFFGEFFPEKMKKRSKFHNVIFVKEFNQESLIPISETLNKKESIGITIPDENNKIGFISDTLDYLLLLDYVNIFRKQTSGGPPGLLTAYGSGDNLMFTSVFVIWDNIKGKMVSYGKITESWAVFMDMTKVTWEKLLYKVASPIVNNKPYGKPKPIGSD
jgi:hypothetical protein